MPWPEVPEQTARAARAAFPKGSLPMRVRDELGPVFQDADFFGAFGARGRPRIAPSVLMLVTVLQFVEQLTDRQAVEAVAGRIDWKYALGLALDDPGFDHSVLVECRARLVDRDLSRLAFDRLLERCRELGLVKPGGGKQRTDATHVIAAVRDLNTMELAGQAVRALIDAIYAQHSELSWLSELRQVSIVCMVMRQTFVVHTDIRGREVMRRRDADTDGLPSAQQRLASPYDSDARWAAKGSELFWLGCKLHLTETCDDPADETNGTERQAPNLITNVHTTDTTAPDNAATVPIHQDLAARDLTAAKQYLDSGYPCVPNVLAARREHGITMITPLLGDSSHQARTRNGYSRRDFTIDYETRTTTCPQGQSSAHWNPQVHEGVEKIFRRLPTTCLLDVRRPTRVHQQQSPPAPDHRLPTRSPRTATGHPQRPGLEGLASRLSAPRRHRAHDEPSRQQGRPAQSQVPRPEESRTRTLHGRHRHERDPPRRLPHRPTHPPQ
jgi:transposase